MALTNRPDRGYTSVRPFYFLHWRIYMNIDCTLNTFSVPGFSGINPDFGTKAPAGQPITSRQEHTNISMPFVLMRPHIVNENSTTTVIEANCVFDITVSGVVLELNEAVYNGCKVFIMNSSGNTASVRVNTTTISLFGGDIIELEYINGAWVNKNSKQSLRTLSEFELIAENVIAASTANVDITTGGMITMDGIALAIGDRVLLKNQTNPTQNGLWVVQSSTWNRDTNYATGNQTAFTSKFISPLKGSQAGRVFFLIQNSYIIGTTLLNFIESKFSVTPIPGKIPMYDKNGILATGSKYADTVEGMGRDLKAVFGITSNNPTVYIPLIMAEIRRRCNNNGEIDNTGIPDFSGIEIGDYVDGIDFSGVSAAPGGTAPQAWNDTYKNNRIEVSGFNTFKNSGDTETTKNHILFTFRNALCQGRMKATDDNSGGYPATEMRIWLEGASGDGIGALATKLKTVLGGTTNYLLTFRSLLSNKGNWAWVNTTLFLPSEENIFGMSSWGEAERSDGLKVHFPIYQKSTTYRCKRLNGAKQWYWTSTPHASVAANFCNVSNYGTAYYSYASNSAGGVSPAFCVA